MPRCKVAICNAQDGIDAKTGCCILHSPDPNKDNYAFREALELHRNRNGDDYTCIVFPEPGYMFMGAVFDQRANFNLATFCQDVYFVGATFDKEATFIGAKFAGRANFQGATFLDRANFSRATFARGADFDGTRFEGKGVRFSFSSFVGRTLFTSRREDCGPIPIFAGAEVDFVGVFIDPPDAVSFREADLSKCRFLDTDLRKVEFTGVIWPKSSGRIGVYDEIVPLEAGDVPPWSRTERLYRELKQNCEDRRDYERAGDFHYGEKEMRRRNPETRRLLRSLLTLYWLFSGYGERYMRPLIWAGGLLAVSATGYLLLGLSPKDQEAILDVTNWWDWLKPSFYSLRVMTLLRPDDLVPIGFAKIVHAMQSLLGPLFLGLFALAVRQRLKR